MSKKYCYDFPRPAVTADCVIFGWDAETLKVLLIERGNDPFKGSWALPGGFFDMEDEDADAAAARELEEETGLTGIFLEQFHTFSKKGRDPRGRTVSVAYLGLVKTGEVSPKAGDDAASHNWFDIGIMPEMAFDHNTVLSMAMNRLNELLLFQKDQKLFQLFAKEDLNKVQKYIENTI